MQRWFPQQFFYQAAALAGRTEQVLNAHHIANGSQEPLARSPQPGVPLLGIRSWSISSFFCAPEREVPPCGSTVLSNYLSGKALLCSLLWDMYHLIFMQIKLSLINFAHNIKSIQEKKNTFVNLWNRLPREAAESPFLDHLSQVSKRQPVPRRKDFSFEK